MFKKRAMAEDRWVGDSITSYTPVKHFETGYADNQSDYPYWVSPQEFSRDEWFSMDHWVRTTMGDTDWSSGAARWVGSNRKYWFRTEQDRTMFILRWS